MVDDESAVVLTFRIIWIRHWYL